MLVSFLIGFVVLCIAWSLFRKKDDPLDKVPGPPTYPIVGAALMFIGKSPNELFYLTRELWKTYGDRFLVKVIGRKILHIHSPQDIEAVLSHSKNITKSYPYSFLAPWLGDGLLLSTGATWQRRRKILTPAFHFNILKNFSVIIEEKGVQMVEEIKKRQGEEIDIIPVVSNFTLHTICETAMGTKLDGDSSSEIKEYKSAILNIGLLFFKRLTTFWLHNKYIFMFSKIYKNYQDVLSKLLSFAENVIQKKKDGWSQSDVDHTVAALEGEDIGLRRRLAMMDLLLHAESKGQIDLAGVRDEVNTFMFEGHDTTAMALTFALMLLADHEHVQDKIFEELTNKVGAEDKIITYNELTELKYLEAVIKEILRLYPSVPFIARLITEDFFMGDLEIRKDTEIAVHIYDLHRRGDLFEDPNEFRPERFLEGGPKHPYAFIPFSAGPRNCIGQRFAMLEMKSILSKICREFVITRKNKGSVPQMVSDIILRPLNPITVQFNKRT